jgi:hypothetical protein
MDNVTHSTQAVSDAAQVSDTPRVDALLVVANDGHDLLPLARQLEREICELERDSELLHKGCLIEIAVRNASVAEHMRHWEQRAITAEENAARYLWLRECLPFVKCDFDATYDPKTEKPAMSFRSLGGIARKELPGCSLRAWDSRSDSQARIDAAIDAAIAKAAPISES